jgi:outer membrane protein assembly factor BamB
MKGDLVAINAATGEIIWDVLIDGDPTGGMTVVNDLVITATFQGNVVAYQRETGKEVWRWKAPGGINAWMSVVGDTIVIPIGSSDPPSVVALRLSGAATSGTQPGTGGLPVGGSTAKPETGSASFSAIYSELLSKRCAGPVCHSGNSTGGSLNVMGTDASAAHAALIGRPASGSECSSSGLPLVTAGQPDKSLLYLKVAGMPPCGSRMPPTGALPQADVDRLRTWIANGAAND